MLLENKIAIIYGAGGAVGGAVARALARDGAIVFLADRTLAPVQAVAEEISAEGGTADAAQVDALDEQAIERQVADAAAKARPAHPTRLPSSRWPNCTPVWPAYRLTNTGLA